MVSPVTVSEPRAFTVPLLLEKPAPVIVQFWPFKSNVPAELVKLPPLLMVKGFPVNCKVPAPVWVSIGIGFPLPPVLSVWVPLIALNCMVPPLPPKLMVPLAVTLPAKMFVALPYATSIVPLLLVKVTAPLKVSPLELPRIKVPLPLSVNEVVEPKISPPLPVEVDEPLEVKLAVPLKVLPERRTDPLVAVTLAPKVVPAKLAVFVAPAETVICPLLIAPAVKVAFPVAVNV